MTAPDPRHERFMGDEFAGIDTFPFASTEISLAAVNHRILALAEALLGDDDVHLYGAEAWAKYTGACDYDQALHRDYLNHTVLVPSTTPGCQQVEMFVFLNDVPDELGPPHLVSRKHTADLPAVPNWLLRPGQEGTDRFVAEADPQLYEAEVSGAGPAGTVIAFETGRLRPWQAWHCAIRGSTFRPGDRRARKRSGDKATPPGTGCGF